MQYFLVRSHSSGDFKTPVPISVIIFGTLLLNLPTLFAAAQSTNDGSLKNLKKPTGSVIATVVKDVIDVDIVGFGEDCSSDGPYCDKTRHFICDPVEETCICDEKHGFIHIDNIPGGMEQYFPIEYDAEGNPYYSLNGNVCINKDDIIAKTDELLGLPKKGSTVDTYVQQEKSSSKHSEYYDDDELGLNDYDDIFEADSSEKNAWPPEETLMATGGASGARDSNVYEEFFKNAGIKQPKYDEGRLERFKLKKKQERSHLQEKNIIIHEILNYRRGPVSLDGLQMFLEELLHLHFRWRKNKLSNSICSLIFDVDRDELFSYEEYVIALYSEKVRALVIPKVFLSLIGPLIEDSCISMQDVQALDHNPETLEHDFYLLDINMDGCISKDEFSKYANMTCWVNWLTDYLRDIDLQLFVAVIDPSPEEMFVRRLMQNERLGNNWRIVDKNKDGFISTTELNSDLAPYEFSSETMKKEVDALMKCLDKNKDRKISMEEVKLQMSVPELTKEYQLEWLESLYELYDSDEDEVKEYLETFSENDIEQLFDEALSMETNSIESGTDRIFTIFDRNRNGEMDMVEFKLVLELIKKFVVYDILNETVGSIDMDSDRKVTFFEYEEFFKNASATFRTYFKNLLAMEDEIEQIGNEEEENYDDDEYDEEGDEDDTSEDDNEKTVEVSSTKLSKRAAASNETSMVYKLFVRLDANSDGFITKDDFYVYASSYKAKKSPSELKQEFLQLDLNKDGLLTVDDSEEFVISIDFDKFKETANAFSEEVFPNDLEDRYPKVDANKDGIIQKHEFRLYSAVLFNSNEENVFLEWVEIYMKEVPILIDEASEKAFAEFDTNCNRFISETEFRAKVEDLQGSSKTVLSCSKSPENITRCFQVLDLNKDGKVSLNEFNLLVLRTGKVLSSQ